MNTTANLSLLTETEKAYLAALFDTSMTFYIAEEYYKKGATVPAHTLQLVVTSRDRKMLSYWRAKTGLGSLHMGSKAGLEMRVHWRISSNQAEMLVRAVMPYLIVKREQAQVALDFRATYTNKNRTPEIETVERRKLFRRIMLEMTHAD